MKKEICQEQLKQNKIIGFNDGNVMFKIEELKNTKEVIIPSSEGDYLEYKQSMPKDTGHIAKLLVAIANTDGGCVIFGARETKNGGLIIGLGNGELQNFLELEKKITGFIEKNYIRAIDARFVTKTVNGKTIGCIFIQKNLNIVFGLNRVKGEYILPVLNSGAVAITHYHISTDEVKELDIYNHTHFVELETNMNSGLFWRFNGNKRPRWEFVYKYMTLDAFIQCIEHGNIMFQEPCGWKDQFESRFYKAYYQKPQYNADDTPKIFSTCFTRARDCEASWKVYSNDEKGLKSRCVQIKIDVNALREQLLESARGGNNHRDNAKVKGVQCDVYEGEVSYKFSEYEILRFHETSSPFHAFFFNSFNLNHFIGLLLYKRPAYEYEKEVRYFMVPTTHEQRQNQTNKVEKLYVDLDWGELIQMIRYDKNCSDSEIQALKTICERKGIILSKKCTKAKKIKKAVYRVPFKSFDIDKMQGRKHIIIK